MTTESTFVALLRGINVGGKHRLPMEELREIFEQTGCDQVRTYIQSGNVVFRAEAAALPALGPQVEAAIGDRYGFQSPVIFRSAAELDDIVARNPFTGETDEESLHVMFLRSTPSAGAVSALDPDEFAPDDFAVSGREIFLRCPNGVARSRLTSRYFDSRLETVSTVRNWRTVRTLLEMSRG